MDMQKFNSSHTVVSILILVTMKELLFIYHLTDVNTHDYFNTMETVQRSRTTGTDVNKRDINDNINKRYK